MTDSSSLLGSSEDSAGDESLLSHEDKSHQGEGNMLDLVRDLIKQSTQLADQQLRLVKAEMRESVADVKVAVSALAVAVVGGIAGLTVILTGLSYALASEIGDLGAALIIVGIATLLLAFVAYRRAVGKMNTDKLMPDRTARTLQRTPDAVRGEL